jgi:hypothetical protein
VEEVSTAMVEVVQLLVVRMEVEGKEAKGSSKEVQEDALGQETVREVLEEGVGHTGMEGELEGEEGTQEGHQVIM